MTANEKRMLEREALRSVIQQWNANRLDLFELSEPDEVCKLSYHNISYKPINKMIYKNIIDNKFNEIDRDKAMKRFGCSHSINIHHFSYSSVFLSL